MLLSFLLVPVSGEPNIQAICCGKRGIAEHASVKPPGTAVAARYRGAVDDSGFPQTNAWKNTKPVHFDTDWQGLNADPQRSTEIRLLWTTENLYLKFVSRYRVITVFSDAEPDGRRDKLWDRDVAEVFLQPDPGALRRYKEFEVSPNGFWIDLDIDNGALADLKSGLKRRVAVDESTTTWTAELAIPIKSLVPHFDPRATWRVNFYRVEGAAEPRFYSSWQPTNTAQPNFHVPELFGYLKFAAP
jgi:alpha-galactosidase